MTEINDSPDFVPVRIRRIMSEVKGLLSQHDDVTLRDLWKKKWAPAFLKIVEEREQRPQVEISLMGGTGAGKSTLVNALLEARILPVSNMRACTAAISEVAYADDGEYRATIEFVSRESWHEEIELLLADIRDGQAELVDDADRDAIAIPKLAKDKLAAVYGPWESDDLPSLNIADYSEPPEIANALDNGRTEFATPSLSDFRKHIRDYLDSKRRFWPIVKAVRMSGPFAALKCGAKLVDLPGINDPNAAREQVTKDYLKNCRFVWVVFNIKRVLTKDVSSLMQSDDFVRQIVMDGRENALTFVGTASDDIDIDSACEEFDLDEEASFSEIAKARNDSVRREVATQVGEIAHRIAANADSPERAAMLKEALLASRIFTASARDYLALSNLAKNRATLATVEETEIEQLREHMIRVCDDFGVDAQARSHHAQINNILNEVKAAVARSRANIDQKQHLTASKREELGEAITRLTGFLDRNLEDIQERFSQELSSGQDVLAERVKRAIDRARHDLTRTIEQWRRIHWATLRAVARRGGAFNSPTSGMHDFSADVAKPILDGITFAWSDFFGDRLTSSLAKWSDKLMSLAERQGLDVLREFDALKLRGEFNLEADFKSVVETTEMVIREQVGQIQADMHHSIDEVRRHLYEDVAERIATEMRQPFLDAAKESGSGMKQRMLDGIARHADRVSQDMFADIEEQLGTGVRGLNSWLGKKYGEMTSTIKRHAEIPVGNLLGREHVSEDELDKLRETLDDVSQAVNSIPIVEVRRPQRPDTSLMLMAALERHVGSGPRAG